MTSQNTLNENTNFEGIYKHISEIRGDGANTFYALL